MSGNSEKSDWLRVAARFPILGLSLGFGFAYVVYLGTIAYASWGKISNFIAGFCVLGIPLGAILLGILWFVSRPVVYEFDGSGIRVCHARTGRVRIDIEGRSIVKLEWYKDQGATLTYMRGGMRQRLGIHLGKETSAVRSFVDSVWGNLVGPSSEAVVQKRRSLKNSSNQ